MLVTGIISLAIMTYSNLLSVLGFYSRARTDKLARIWARKILNAARIRRSKFIHHPIEYLPNKAYMIMCNHSSLYDIPIIFEAIPGSIRMLTKSELGKIPILSLSLKLNEFIFINRHNREQAMQDLAKAKQKMEDGIILWVAPEGTRSKTGKLLRFKKGVFHLAIQTEAIIIPVGIRGASQVLPSKTLALSSDQPVEVHVGKPIDASEFNEDSKDLLLKKVEKVMRELVDEPSKANL